MRIVLVGADFEENLGIGMIGAAAREAGHSVAIVPFDYAADTAGVAREVVAEAPDVVGLSIQFQHRGQEFLALARRIRARGFRGHLTCGGQYPTLAWRELLEGQPAVDSVVLHEGEETIVALLDALGRGTPLAEVAGLAIRADDGAPVRTAARPLVPDLDTLPVPMRYRPHAQHAEIPFIPILGSRGCWGSCTYCSITSFYRDARSSGGGALLRERSPRHVAAEMALLAHSAGGRAIFCFHDDNFLRPRARDSLARVRAMRAALDEFAVRDVGIIGKARPDCLVAELARELAALGVLRLYVGVENASQQGADHLERRTQTARVRGALAAYREANIFACYNLLIFEPDATLDDIRENVAFIREHAMHPVNFCRAEPYFGTPLHGRLADRAAIEGSYLGFNYRISDDPTELLFRISAAAFRQRNFDAAGVANRSMGLGYTLRLIQHFHPDPRGRVPRLASRVDALTREISTETAAFLEQAIALAEAHGGDADMVARETALLGLRIAGADQRRHAELDELYRDLAAHARGVAMPSPVSKVPSVLITHLRGMAFGASLAMTAAACNACGSTPAKPPDQVEPRRDLQVVDPVPPPPDPLPPPSDPVPPDDMVVDPAPPDQPPPPDTRRRRRHHVPIAPDPLPRDQPPVTDPVPSEMKPSAAAPSSTPAVDHWTDTAPRHGTRSHDLPLFDPPVIVLQARRDDDAIVIRLTGPDVAMSLRWQSNGPVEPIGDANLDDAREVRWTPATLDDQLRVAARTEGGVAITSVRVRDIRG